MNDSTKILQPVSRLSDETLSALRDGWHKSRRGSSNGWDAARVRAANELGYTLEGRRRGSKPVISHNGLIDLLDRLHLDWRGYPNPVVCANSREAA